MWVVNGKTEVWRLDLLHKRFLKKKVSVHIFIQILACLFTVENPDVDFRNGQGGS